MGCLESFIINYGYLAILIGSMVEGEIILVLGGLAAYSGYLSLPWVIGIAFFGTFVADQIYFFLGRWHSPRILAARPSWKLRMNKAERLFRRFRTPLILIFRFLYGIRAVLVFVIGMSQIPSSKFALLNGLGAMIWAITVGTGGYFFGSVFEMLLGKIKAVELTFLGALLMTGSVVWVARFFKKKWSRA
ncbi:MAG: DedA family protein [Desulfobacteraceae bacterium]|nr:MAG: DedA family protein [Desulfobacteraceae bacterium]